jgi:hypothetical protein
MDHHDPHPLTRWTGLEVTRDRLKVGDRQYELTGLRQLETRQSAHDPLTRQAAILAGLGLLTLVLLARFMQPAGIAASAAVLSGLAGVALFSSHRRPRRQELWAVYKGYPVRLFSSSDPWVYGAVTRQLRRGLAEARLGKPARREPLVPSGPMSAVPHPSMMHPSLMRPGY